MYQKFVHLHIVSTLSHYRHTRTKFEVLYTYYYNVCVQYIPYSLDVPTVQRHCDISEMEQEMKQLQEAAALFEVNVPDFKQLRACRREIRLLKSLWDMIIIVRSSFEDWNTTLWKDINVENMEMDCKKFVKVSHYIYTFTYVYMCMIV